VEARDPAIVDLGKEDLNRCSLAAQVLFQALARVSVPGSAGGCSGIGRSGVLGSCVDTLLLSTNGTRFYLLSGEVRRE
jgi:hypothetical protein